MLTNEALGAALTAAMKLKGVRAADIAREFGVKPPSVNGWQNDGQIAKKHLDHMFEYFSDVVGPEHWGLTSFRDQALPSSVKTLPEGNPEGTEGDSPVTIVHEETFGALVTTGDRPPDRYVRLQVLGVASAGPGHVATPNGEVVPQVDVLESWLRSNFGNAKNLRVLTARGHSMTGMIENGDLMFVEPCTRFDPDGLYILTEGDLVRVKKLQARMAEKVLLISSNDGSEPERVPIALVDETIRIQGRVVGVWTLRTKF